MDLRSGCSYWTQTNPPPHAPALDQNLDTHVAILGGGITGALAAHYLIEAGVDAAIVDRRDIARGSTAASTGLLQYEIDKPLVELIPLAGEHTATRAYQLGRDALGWFDELTRELGDDCGFALTRSILLASSADFVPLLRRECEARRRIGLRVDYLSASDLRREFGVERPGALLSHEAARVDPVRLTSALIKRAVKRGLRAFGHTQIDHYAVQDTGVTLTTDAGHTIRAKHAIFATGYETPEFLTDIPVRLRTTYAMATTPVARHECPLIWETGMPYFYLRPDGDRLIVGGEDDDFSDPAAREACMAEKTATLTRKLSELMPGRQFEVDCAWAGTFAETPDSLPYIGPHPQFPRGLFALGYGGNGITFAMIAARMLRDRILGRPDPDQDLFRFDR